MNKIPSREVRQLTEQIKSLNFDLAEARESVAEANTLLAIIKQQILQKEEDLEQIKFDSKVDELYITDHAILRLIERVYGINIKDVESIIRKHAMDGFIKNGRIKCSEGYTLVIANNSVVTIIGNNGD